MYCIKLCTNFNEETYVLEQNRTKIKSVDKFEILMCGCSINYIVLLQQFILETFLYNI